MDFSELSKATLWIAGIGLVWNLFGFAAFVGQMMMDTSTLPELQQNFHDTMPIWAKVAFFTAVSMGVVGCGALLAGQDWARIAFALSLVGIIVQNIHSFVLSNGLEAFGNAAIAMPVMVFGIAVFLLYYSNSLLNA